MDFSDGCYSYFCAWFYIHLVKLRFEEYISYNIQLCYLTSQTVTLPEYTGSEDLSALQPLKFASKGLYVAVTNMLEHLSEMIHLEESSSLRSSLRRV